MGRDTMNSKAIANITAAPMSLRADAQASGRQTSVTGSASIKLLIGQLESGHSDALITGQRTCDHKPMRSLSVTFGEGLVLRPRPLGPQ
jgi:hypothetical protein